jgi:aspartyl-tRNA(Asn)/glutamyl-tRNA(Gln) amidotransferase subunit A
MSELLTIAEAARRIAARKLSPVELTRDCLDRIARLDGRLHAFIAVLEERAIEEARAAEAEIMASGPRSPLHGIPIGLKDIFETKGIPTTGHSRVLQDHVPAEDGAVVEKLAEAGSVLLGKLATHEFAFGGPSFDLPWPPARNPWNPAHFTAGSSSGTGAAVAAGMVLGGTGSDTGGSIRGPASLCGIAGIKPTYGLVSRHGVLPLAWSLDHAGPMAWTAEDCALLLQAMAGHDKRDPASVDRPVPNFTRRIGGAIKGLRIGVVRHWFETDNPATETSRKAIDAALDVFRGLGAEIRDVTLSPLPEWHAAGYIILLGETYAVHEAWLKQHPEKYGEIFRDRVVLGATISGATYLQAVRRRRELIAEIEQATLGLDILVSVSQTGEAPRIDEVSKWATAALPSYTLPFNLTGWPAMSVCCGFGSGGLPLGIQLAARPFEDALLLRVADAYERATDWRGRRPALAMEG